MARAADPDSIVAALAPLDSDEEEDVEADARLDT